jgi:release factor glutamine methyltransferase
VIDLAGRVAQARESLLAVGIPPDEAAGDAEVLARHALQWDLTQYTLARREPPPAGFQEHFDRLIARRIKREPVSQIVGHREFWGLDFEVTRDVLTPRPETELVVQATLDVCRTHRASEGIIVDIGTGSGCIAIALATELPGARFIASDASLAALTVARRNARRHGVGHRIAFLHSSMIPPDNDFEIIVSNPPYIPLPERNSLAPEVRDHEPDIALFGGADGLDFYRKLFDDHVPGCLNGNGWVIVEVGYDQADSVRALVDRRYWEIGRSYHDVQGIERVLTFRVTGNPFTEGIDDEEAWKA